jgi:hypothetical protein
MHLYCNSTVCWMVNNVLIFQGRYVQGIISCNLGWGGKVAMLCGSGSGWIRIVLPHLDPDRDQNGHPGHTDTDPADLYQFLGVGSA